MIKFPILPPPPADSDPEQLRDYLRVLVDDLTRVLDEIIDNISDLVEKKDARDRRNAWK